MSPQDVVSFSEDSIAFAKEAVQAKKDKEESGSVRLSMRTQATMEAEMAASQPQGIDAIVAMEAQRLLTPSGQVSPSKQHAKSLGEITESHGSVFEKLEEEMDTSTAEAMQEAAQELQAESILQQAVDKVQAEASQPSQSSRPAPQQASSQGTQESADGEYVPTLTTGGGSGSAEVPADPVATGTTAPKKPAKLTTSGSSPEIKVEVKTSAPSAPSAPVLNIRV